ncbi:transposase [Hymenobacter baengnokdamensis]|uniref:transposase n=1 Tax=Hymenobacter baengnokdamensis TaxID=2615203 RepID=UPI001247C6E6|nr:transposase [Hymenobacter baengnokdamensis]
MGLEGGGLSAGAWEKLAPHLAGKAGDVGCTAADNRLFLNAVLWVMRHGGTWRILPQRFGKHDSVRKRALGWAQKGT